MAWLSFAYKKAPLRGFFVGLLLLLGSSVSRADCCAVVSAHPLASEAGMQILQQGGNAFDAAVTISAVLAVVEPYGSGIGGGGFWLLHRARDNFNIMLDGRERAPLKAHRDMYLDADGNVIKGLSIDGPLSAGIPGQPAALVHLAENYGRLPLSETLAPAIELAKEGFAVDEVYQRMAGWRRQALMQSSSATAIFLDNGAVPEKGHVIRQPALAETLQLIAAQGRDGFYAGHVGRALLEAVQAAGGIWTEQDLQAYQVVERRPLIFNYADMRIISAPLPSSGGMVIAQVLNILSWFDLSSMTSVQRKHLLIEAMRRAYQMRADYLGDEDFVSVPKSRLLDRNYARKLARDIHASEATASPADQIQSNEGRDTTHFSVLDADGNRVAATLSVNYPFGSGFVAAGTGVLLNDEMDDFSAKPGVANVYGLIGSRANAIEPGKRMLSSMTPTFVESDDALAILGTPGGSRIISMVLLAILEMQASDNPQDWVDLPRFHHQYLPDRVEYEKGAFSEDEINELTLMGHQLEQRQPYGNMQAIYQNRQTGEVLTASDKRGIGAGIVKP